MPLLKQSTATILKMGPFVSDSDGYSAKTALTIAQADIQLAKNGAALAQTSDASPTTTHDADGWYPIPLTTTDSNTSGRLTIKVTMTNTLPVWREYQVVPAEVFDSLVAGSDKLSVDLAQILGTALTETSGQLAGRFKDFFDQASATFSVATALSAFKATSVTVSDKTGFSLVSTGLALVTAWTVDITGSLSGSVGSVAGAVGSVTTAVTTDTASRTASKATGFSTHDAAAVYTAFGTGGNLTTCATATGFATPTNITAAAGVALSATGGDLIAKTSTFALAMADANCDELLAGHTTADTVGLVLNEWQDDGRLDLLLDAIKVVTDALTSAAATKLALSAGTIVTGAAEAGTLSTTQMTTDLTEATDDHYNGRIVIWTSGVLKDQATDITDYSGATGLLTFTAVTEAPSAADTFVIV